MDSRVCVVVILLTHIHIYVCISLLWLWHGVVVVLEDEEEVLVLGTDAGTVALLHPDAGAAWFHLPQHRRLPACPTCAPMCSAYSLVSSNFRREMIKYNSTNATTGY